METYQENKALARVSFRNGFLKLGNHCKDHRRWMSLYIACDAIACKSDPAYRSCTGSAGRGCRISRSRSAVCLHGLEKSLYIERKFPKYHSVTVINQDWIVYRLYDFVSKFSGYLFGRGNMYTCGHHIRGQLVGLPSPIK